ncbi:MAG: NAD-dependent epimerase/dehydratase family protein, partial [Geobacteraceae bacterium]|nr:NAD-dependent epimerase/dehydratase family protein [Geobacteraceae bacterium]
PLSRTANRQTTAAVDINIKGTANLLEAVRAVGSVRRFVFISSSFVYGDFCYSPADELHPLNPIELYGATKLSGEFLTRAFGIRFGIEFSIVRPSAVYGHGDINGRVVQKMVEDARCGRPLAMHSGGESMLDFTHVDDTVSGIVLAATHPCAGGETFNITRGEGRTVKELVSLLRVHFPGLCVLDSGQDERRPERGCLDISKARRLLNYNPLFSLNEGVASYIESLFRSGRTP